MYKPFIILVYYEKMVIGCKGYHVNHPLFLF